MFLGRYAHNLDAKGRLAIPARYREALAAFEGAPSFTFVDLEVRHAADGRPLLRPGPRLEAWFSAAGLTIQLTISHSGDYATATALASSETR